MSIFSTPGTLRNTQRIESLQQMGNRFFVTWRSLLFSPETGSVRIQKLERDTFGGSDFEVDDELATVLSLTRKRNKAVGAISTRIKIPR